MRHTELNGIQLMEIKINWTEIVCENTKKVTHPLHVLAAYKVSQVHLELKIMSIAAMHLLHGNSFRYFSAQPWFCNEWLLLHSF